MSWYTLQSEHFIQFTKHLIFSLKKALGLRLNKQQTLPLVCQLCKWEQWDGVQRFERNKTFH